MYKAKRNTENRSWKDRYFILSGNELKYYAHPEEVREVSTSPFACQLV